MTGRAVGGEAIYFPGVGEDDNRLPGPLRQKAKGNALSPGKEGGGSDQGTPSSPPPPQPFDVRLRSGWWPLRIPPLPPSQNTHIAGIPLLSDR